MRKKLLILLALVMVQLSTVAQVIQPPKWSYSFSKEEPAVGEEIEITFTATIPPGWYIYSNDFDPDLGPTLTTVTWEKNASFELANELRAIEAKHKYDDIFMGDVGYFIGTGTFKQSIRVLELPVVLKGVIDYQMCTDIDGRCIPFEEDIDITLGQSPGTSSAGSEGASTEAATADESVLKSRDTNDAYSLLAFMVLSFLAGLAALLTPCVFPMIPLTVSFFTGKSATRKKAQIHALFFGFSIIAIYTIAGTIVARINGPEFANWLSTHWIPNVAFFIIFIFFALAFLGMFELTLPSGLVNRVDRQADKGGFYGTFFMGFTLVLVSFSCTGPIVGTILVESAGGLVLKPILGMFAFSLAFAIPFTLFAIFPEWLQNLPKSGGWMNTIKVTLGFLELALAFKFLSIADQVYHWGILDRDVFLVIWIAVFLGLTIYLFGYLRLPHDDKVEQLSVPRLLTGLVSLGFVIYLLPGLWGAPLKGLAGYLPPMRSGMFTFAGGSMAYPMVPNAPSDLCEEPKYADLFEWPHGLQGYFDYEQALRCAREQNKPLFIDFTGHGCVNCREMEARVWSEPEVLKRLNEDFVLVALYVDDKMELPSSQWYTSTYDGKEKKTIGKQNADFQITRFNNNAQPYYVILDGNEELLVAPKAYDLDPKNFVQFLDAAKSAYLNGEMAHLQ
jgi:thiol:disulfide interchange protein DsbD